MFGLKPVSSLGIAGTVLGIAFFLFNLLSDKAEKRDSMTWPSTGGQYTYCGVMGKSGPWSSTNRMPRYVVDIRYTYEVDGKQFTGSRVQVDQASYLSTTTAKENLQGCEIGKRVDVYYNPRKPKASVLNRA